MSAAIDQSLIFNKLPLSAETKKKLYNELHSKLSVKTEREDGCDPEREDPPAIAPLSRGPSNERIISSGSEDGAADSPACESS